MNSHSTSTGSDVIRIPARSVYRRCCALHVPRLISPRAPPAGFTAVRGIGGDRTRPIGPFFTNRYCPIVGVQNGVVVNRGAASVPRGHEPSLINCWRALELK
ncbi:hypothetical protein AOLI_G00085170 [Acnodon oligacanthus]